MSGIYITEPPTCGKVLVKTTYGDIDIEIWSKEAPLACKNFVQLCLEGYYDDCPIHRIIKGFMVQSGDPTGTGTGGESIWGKPFKDELHGRIKFNHRGQVAMANEQKPNSNHSQFFITLDACEWLNRKHTIFGKVTGVTMFNLLRMNDAEVDASERPLEAVKIISCEVLMNPFDDIIPRDLSLLKKEAPLPTGGPKKEASSRKATNDKKLLSFGDEEDAGNDAGEGRWTGKTMHSSHDSKYKDERLSSEVAEELQGIAYYEVQPIAAKAPSSSSTSSSSSARAGGMRSAILSKLRASQHSRQGQRQISQDVREGAQEDGEGMEEEVEVEAKLQQPVLEKSTEFKDLRNALLRSKKAVKLLNGADAEKANKEEIKNDVLTPLERQRQKYLKRKNSEHGDREQESLAKLSRFAASLKGKGKQTASRDQEAYHGQVMQRDSDSEEDLSDWNQSKLQFRGHIDDKYRQTGDGRSLHDYVVIDERLR